MMPSASVTSRDELLDWTDESEVAAEPQVELTVIRGLWRTALLTLALMAVTAITVAEVHYWRFRNEIKRKQAAPVSALLPAARARDALRLNRYQWVNRSTGVLRIPVSVAAALVIADYSRAPTEPPKQGSAPQR